MNATPGAGRIVRPPAVAGLFYPEDRGELSATAAALLGSAPAAELPPRGILVPHAGLVYSGHVAAAAWRLLAGTSPTVIVLGTNHSARFTGIATWPGDAWGLPGAEVTVDAELGEAILTLGAPFVASRDAHAREHSIEVQLPLLATVAPASRIVPLAVSVGTGAAALEAGARLGQLLGTRWAAGEKVVLAISSDMAHYPPAGSCARITEALLPPILALDPVELAAAEAAVGGPGVACGMCGIEPSVVGLAALRQAGVVAGRLLIAATSADVGGDPGRTVGYLAVSFA
jgi:MEMO1 family protein